MKVSKNNGEYGVGKVLIIVRIRGVTDISGPQKSILSKFNLRKVNTAVFLQGTA